MNEMNISNARYMNNNKTSILVTIDGQEMSVPIDSANRHYQELQEWVAKGNKIEDAD